MRIEDGLAAIAEGLRENAEAHARVMAAEIEPYMPDLGAEGRHQIFLSCMANVDVFAELLDRPSRVRRSDGPADLPPPPPQTIRYMRMLVHRALDVDSLIRGYRVGQAALWRCCQREGFARIEPESAVPEVLEHCSDLLFRYIDNATEHVGEEFEVERHAYMRWPVARKVEAVLTLLEAGGEAPPADLSAALGYELGRRHLGLVLKAASEREGEGENSRPRAEVLAMRVCRIIAPGVRPLVLPMGNDVVWAWVGGEREYTFATAEVDEIVTENEAIVAFGEPADGLAGFRETHAQAQDAMELSLATGRPVSHYRETALTSLLMADPERAARLMRHRLGELNAETASAARLRETLGVLLATNLNQREAARRIGAHPHTISYRLQQVEKAIGGSVASCAQELHAALLIRGALADRAG